MFHLSRDKMNLTRHIAAWTRAFNIAHLELSLEDCHIAIVTVVTQFRHCGSWIILLVFIFICWQCSFHCIEVHSQSRTHLKVWVLLYVLKMIVRLTETNLNTITNKFFQFPALSSETGFLLGSRSRLNTRLCLHVQISPVISRWKVHS